MSNLFAEKPEVHPVVIAPTWEDPITGFVVPKEASANLQWRADMLAQAENDQEFQVDLYTACSQSELFFINAFVFTLRVKDTKEGGKEGQAEYAHLPFCTWPVQDKHILRIVRGIDEGESLLTDKSRDMGATWDHIAVYVHRLLFRDDESHLMLSRKEDAVDVLDGPPKHYPAGSLADPGTLFGKIDYVLSRLPEWMLPRLMRKKMHLVNLDNHTRIDGESSNATAGSSDRRHSIFLDEMAKMLEGAAVKRSTKDVTACRLVCSTPNGAGTAFSKWRLSGTIPVYIMGWWDHPEKGAGLYVKQDELGRWKIRSPWYDSRCAEDSPKEIATELDMDHVGSGDTFFEATVIEQHKRLFARPPREKLTISFPPKKMSDEQIMEAIRTRDCKKVNHAGAGAWKVWCPLNADRRPDQTKTYTLAFDLGKGQGASNSTCSIMCNETREKIASFADANTPPHEMARVAIAAAIWSGGRGGLPLIIWENNGDPGFDFGNQLVQTYRYPNVYFARAVGTLRQKRGKRYGWRSSPEAKANALGILRRAYAHGKFRNHDADALNECLTYIHYENGGIGPAELVEESDSTRKAHGDRVIADMLCLVAQSEAPRFRSGGSEAPARSFAFRLKQYKQTRRAEKAGTRFDFAGVQ